MSLKRLVKREPGLCVWLSGKVQDWRPVGLAFDRHKERRPCRGSVRGHDTQESQPSIDETWTIQ